MDHPDWLNHYRLDQIVESSNGWTFNFNEFDANLIVLCDWRIVDSKSGRAVSTSSDGGSTGTENQLVDVAAMARSLLIGKTVSGMALNDETLDLTLRFSNHTELQIIPGGSPTEAWNLARGRERFVAAGRTLHISKPDPTTQ